MKGAELREALEALGVSQRWFAGKIGRHPVTLSRWLRDDPEPPGEIGFIVQLLRVAVHLIAAYEQGDRQGPDGLEIEELDRAFREAREALGNFETD